MTSKTKVCLTSLALALGSAGLIYIVFKRIYKLKDAINAFNYLHIKIVSREEECAEVVNELRRRCKNYNAIGFDCEWVSEHGHRHPVALLQLSTYDGYSGLFRLNLMKNIPESLKGLLEDESIYKLGVAPVDDAKYLCEDYSVILKAILDIRHIVQICGYTTGGLAALSRNHLRVVLDKSWRIRCSDWEVQILTDRQIKYAAVDAHVSVKIFVDLLDGYGSNGVWTFFKWKSNHCINWNNLDDVVEKYVDLGFKPNNIVKRGDLSTRKGIMSVSKKYANATRSKPLYHNCFLQAPDGELLCTCDDKKANWYVERQLADVVKEEPLTIRLRFEPSGRSVGDVGRYYQLTKENKCVVCGSTNSYIRKNVVPREYRKYFPEIMKDHSSHDVVLLCSTCHQQSNMRDLPQRLQLAAKCDAPLSHNNNKLLEDSQYKKVKSAARALLYHAQKHNLPEARKKHLEDIILQHYTEYNEVTNELLEEAGSVEVTYDNPEYESHGEKVVQYYHVREGGLLQLEVEWRQHFLDSMKPKYMPRLWSIKHNQERLRVKFDEGRLSEEDMKLIGLTRWL